MKILHVVQGSPEWLALRAHPGRRCASDAPVIMGASPHLRRSDLVRIKATGDEREFTEWERKFLLDKGHEAEAAARPHIEEDLGDEFYPVTATDDDGVHLSSFDGLTMGSEDAFEHKLWNAELAAAIRAGDPTPLVYWQLEHQFITGKGKLKRIHLVCSDGTRENRVSMVYTPVAGRAKQLLASWSQFEEDVANYQHVEVLPKATAEPVIALPALAVNVAGEIAIKSNLDLFGAALAAFIERIPKDPKTDQDFANAENAVKVLQDAQDALEAAEANALAQTVTVDEMRRTVALLVKTARETRLSLHKLVEAKKASIRAEILQSGVRAMAAHILMLNTQLGKAYMPAVVAEFAGAMKGKKTIASLRDAVNTELARVKIAANEIAGKITLNLTHLREHAAGYEALFADAQQLVLKDPEHFALVVKTRVDDHKKAEADRAEKLAEAARERIRQEEADKLKAAPTEQPPASTPGPQTATVPRLAVVSGVSKQLDRPSDDEIIAALALKFRVHESKVIEWLLAMDLTSASQRMTAEFR